MWQRLRRCHGRGAATPSEPPASFADASTGVDVATGQPREPQHLDNVVLCMFFQNISVQIANMGIYPATSTIPLLYFPCPFVFVTSGVRIHSSISKSGHLGSRGILKKRHFHTTRNVPQHEKILQSMSDLVATCRAYRRPSGSGNSTTKRRRLYFVEPQGCPSGRRKHVGRGSRCGYDETTKTRFC